VPVPDDVRERLHADLEPYRRAFVDVRWLEPATWHVTLVFVGSARVALVTTLTVACDEIAGAWPPFRFGIAAGGGRIQRGDGVAWVSGRTNAHRVIEVADDLERTIERGPAGSLRPRRAMSAHLTVARRAHERLVASMREQAHGPLRAEWLVDRITLMRSHLGRTGAAYETIHEAPLRGTPRT
jgi:2'-5' RNA ligase